MLNWRSALPLMLALVVANPARAEDRVPSRKEVDVASYPWSSIAKIYNSAGGACTGTLVHPQKVLTAAHCLFSHKSERFLPAEAIHVLLGYDRGRYRTHAVVASYLIGSGYQPNSEEKTIQADWAILTLTQPLDGGTRPIEMSVGNPSSQTIGIFAGFSRLRPFVLTAEHGCLMSKRVPDLIVVANCSAMPGDSGGPILTKTIQGSYRVVAIQIANFGGADRQRMIALDTNLPALRDALAEGHN